LTSSGREAYPDLSQGVTREALARLDEAGACCEQA
jgi:hypothetical protein